MTNVRPQRTQNFMRQFRAKTGSQELQDITASQLLMIWDHYDLDGNGFLEGDELDQFLREFTSSVCNDHVSDEVVSDTMLQELKKDFMDAYDENDDGKIEIRELAQMLPTDENFLLIFQLDNRISSSVDFMEIWKQYDTDGSGSIESDELKNFLKDLIFRSRPNAAVTDAKLCEYANALIVLFDDNKDGKLQLSEMARLLPVKENALKATLNDRFLRGSVSVSPSDVESIFDSYDKDGSGEIEGEELKGLVKDLLEMMKPSYTAQDVDKFYSMMMKSCDLDGDGKISKIELTMLLLGLRKFQKH